MLKGIEDNEKSNRNLLMQQMLVLIFFRSMKENNLKEKIIFCHNF